MDKLTSRIEYNREQREKIFNRDQPYKDRMREIHDAYNVTKLDFFCTVCDTDFSGNAYKQVRTLGPQIVAYYVGLCPRRHKCLRYITDKYRDPYYWTSKVLARQRVDLADAILTPDNPRFRLVYPEQWRQLTEDTKHDH